MTFSQKKKPKSQRVKARAKDRAKDRARAMARTKALRRMIGKKKKNKPLAAVKKKATKKKATKKKSKPPVPVTMAKKRARSLAKVKAAIVLGASSWMPQKKTAPNQARKSLRMLSVF